MAGDDHTHDNHGRTPANWTGSVIIMLAFVVGTLGVVFTQPIVFWIGVALVPVGLIVWKVMSGMEASSEDAG
jgi:hypothetical protein